MKDSEWRPVLKQVWQDNDSDPAIDEPLVTIANSNKKTVPIVWSVEAKDPPNFPFKENSGFLIDIPENAGPTCFFNLFLSDNLISFLVVETNRYAEKVLDEIIIKRNSWFKEGKPIDFDEMKLFLGILIQMGMLNLPRLSDYWSTDPLFKTYTWRKTMSRSRFFYSYAFGIFRYHAQMNDSAGLHFSWIILMKQWKESTALVKTFH